MLINFSVENWQSFREKATLSMVASREEQHQDRISKIDKYGIKLLPAAAIYGGNASGKTKFFRAMKFAKLFVTRITQPDSAIPREYFKLDKKCATKPSKFNFELLIENFCYEFSFSVTDQKVIEEKLTKIKASSEKILYHRMENKKIIFSDNSILKNDTRLQFVAEGTRDNQLFLTKSVDEKFDYFQPIYDWFKNTLVLIDPGSLFLGHVDISGEISKFDTGIASFGEKNIPLENMQLPEDLKMRLREDATENKQVNIRTKNSPERFTVIKKDGGFIAKKLVPHHKTFEGNEISFELKDESAGTLRLMDLLPAFKDLLNHNKSKIYFIDEIDRCLHTLITRSFLETYFQTCDSENRSQLLFTTHDALLMDQKLFRRDEIWVAEKDQRGCSSLTSFGEHKNIRVDKDIRKSYLQGHLGGIPKILLWNIDDKKSNNKKKTKNDKNQ